MKFLNKIEVEEEGKKQAMNACTDISQKAQLAQDYSEFNGTIQNDLKKLMSHHKKELDEFTPRQF